MVGKAGIIVMVAVTIATAVIVTVVGDITTRTVTAILMAVMAAIVTVIGAGALLVVTRPIIAGARVTPEALPAAVAQLVRQGTSMPPMKAPVGKFAFHCMSSWRFVGFLGIRANIVAGQG